MSRFLKLLAVTSFVLLIFIFLIYLKIRHEVPLTIQKAIGAPISYEKFNLDPFKGLEFVGLNSSNGLGVDTFRIRYTLSSLLSRNIREVTVIGFRANIQKMRSGKHEKKTSPQADTSIKFIASIDKLNLIRGVIEVDTSGNSVEIDSVTGTFSVWNIGIDGTFSFSIKKANWDEKTIPEISGQMHISRDGSFSLVDFKADRYSIRQISGKLINGNICLTLLKVDLGKIQVNSLDLSFDFTKKMGSVSFSNVTAPKIFVDVGYSDFTVLPRGAVSIKDAGIVLTEPVQEIIEIPFAQYTTANKDIYARVRVRGDYNGDGLIRGTPDSLWIGMALDSIFQRNRWIHSVFVSASWLRPNYLLFHEVSIEDYNLKVFFQGSYNTQSKLLVASLQIDTMNLSILTPRVKGWLKGNGRIALIGKHLLSYRITAWSKNIRIPETAGLRDIFVHIDTDSLILRSRSLSFKGTEFQDITLLSSISQGDNKWTFLSGIDDSGEIKMTGEWRADHKTFSLICDTFNFRYKTIRREGKFPLSVSYSPDSLIIQLDTTSILEGRTALHMVYEPSLKSIELDFFAESLSLFELDSTGITPVGGYLSTQVEITNTLSRPRLTIEGQFDSLHLTPDTSKGINGSIVEAINGMSLRFKASYADSILNVRYVNLGDGNAIKLTGYLPIVFSIAPPEFKMLEKQLYLTVNTDSFDLAPLRPFLNSFMLIGNGYFQTHASVQGDFKHPIMEGKLRAFVGNALLTTTNTPIRDMLFDSDLRGNSLVISRITARSGEHGRIAGNGYITFGDSVFTDLKFELDSVPLYPRPEMISTGSGSLEIKGKIPEIFIGADMELHEAYINIPFGREMFSSKPKPSPIRFRFHLHGARNIFFYNPNVDMELSMDVTISKEDEVNVNTMGEFQVLNGKFYYLDRTFDITEGWVRLTGGPELNPEIHLKAEGIVADTVIVNLIVTGTLKHPQIELTSSPPMDRLDIISLIAFGKPIGELQLEQEDVELLRKRALSFAEGMMSREIRKLLASYGIGISEFMVQADPWSGRYTSFTVGVRPSPNMLFRYNYDPRAVDHFTVQIKYFLRKNIAIYAERERNGEFATGFELEFRW